MFFQLYLIKDGAGLIHEKIRESRLRWFGHVQRRVINALVRKSELIQMEGTKEGRPKIILIEVTKKGLIKIFKKKDT